MERVVRRISMLVAMTVLLGCQATSGKTAGETMNDASISTAVQAKLTSDRLSNFTRVDVDTDRGVVQLSGIVQSADQKKRAEELARQVDGVKRVHNNLQIQKEPTRTGRIGD